MNPFPHIYRGVAQTLAERKYVGMLFAFALFFFALFVFIPVATIPGNTFLFQLSIFRPQDYVLLIALALLTGLNISMNIYAARKRTCVTIPQSAASGTFAGLSGAFGAAIGIATCPSCYAFVFSALGLGFGSIAFIFEHQTIFFLGALILVAFSLSMTARKVNGACRSC